MCFAGVVFMAFGPSYSYSLIRLLYGKKWSDGEASTVLRYYCFYVIVLAMNGNSPLSVAAQIFIL
jgi:oligosaccharide translocation protein RFT1